MDISGPKLTYNANQHRVKVEISKALALTMDAPPADLKNRAEKKLKSVKESGEIIDYKIHDDCLTKIWRALREDRSLSSEQVISLTLGIGFPSIDELIIHPSKTPHALVEISILADRKKVSNWYYEWIEFAIIREMERQKISGTPNVSQIKGALLRASTGLKVENLSISAKQEPPSKEESQSKPFSMVANKARMEVSLVIRDLQLSLKKLNDSNILNLVANSVKKLESQDGKKYHILKNEVTTCFQALQTSPELLGFNLPVVILCAVGSQSNQVNSKLTIDVSNDGMTATLSKFSMNIYDEPGFQHSKEWFGKQLQRSGLSSTSIAPFLPELAESARKREDLNGRIVAQGTPPVNGKNPYLFESFKENINTSINYDSDTIDIRDLQQKTLCKPGTLVAEIRYHNEAKNGKDVYGKTITPTNSEEFKVEIGEGIQMKEDGKFYATCEGVAVIEENTVFLSKAMIHKGDVNLRTGNIVFNGPIEIEGSVDSGAIIDANGDVVIKGNVRGAIVKSLGSIFVKGGIVTGENGKIVASGDIHAEFIENSTVHCEGNLTAKKAIINSNAIVGGSIEVLNQEDGILAGGSLSCRYHIRTTHLGFKRGALTRLKLGADWKIEKAIAIRSKRLERLSEYQKNCRLEMRELAAKKKSQLTRKHKERKEQLQKRVQQARSIIEKLESQLESLRLKLSFNMSSIIFVSGILSNNIEVNIGGNSIKIPQDLAGIGILAKKKRGSHIVAIEEAEVLLKEKEGGEKQSA